MKICIASHNPGKIEELNHMLSGKHVVVGLTDIGFNEEIPETGKTLAENSLIKAQAIFDRFRIPVVADDSGLLVDSLNGEPGVYSARYAGVPKDDNKNMDLLLENLDGKNDRSAQFQTVISFIDQSGEVRQFTGQVEGVIIHEKKGTNGFGYDPIFKPNGYDLTFAELGADVKNKISHRANAVSKLIEHLNTIDG
ncbi:MAG: non-canonical purine NTP diphosphatase [Ekhidna sp.]